MKAGLGKSEITCFIPGIGMMGYGKPQNIVASIMTPLHSRACVFQDSSDNPFIFVNIEQCFVSIKITREVLSRLQNKYPEKKITFNNLMITAQHTHAAPGGFSEYSFYNFSIPGFSRNVFDTVVDGIVASIDEALSSLFEVSIEYTEVEAPENMEVAFNRSVRAYNANDDTKNISEDEASLAVERKMLALKLRDKEGELKGLINWFGVHCTSVSNENTAIHHDNKGVASILYEKKNPGCIAIFAQGLAGDISPNWIWDRKLKRTRGRYKDQYENADYNGQLQFDLALQLENNNALLSFDKISAFHSFFDYAAMAAAPAHGSGFFKGTKEGPAVHPFLISIINLISSLNRMRVMSFGNEANKQFIRDHGNKKIVVDHRNGEVLGLPISISKYLGFIPDPILKSFSAQARSGALDTLPWVPAVVPVQLVFLGEVAIAGIPGEITTVAGKRLRDFLQKQLQAMNIKKVIISSYANGYMGYITTPEEYDQQMYEGAHTVYGRAALATVLLSFDLLLTGKSDFQSSKCFRISDEELKKRSVCL